MSALGTALLAFTAIWWLAERYRETTVVDWLRRAGQMSLSIYIAHALVFCLLVDWLDVVSPGGLATSLTFAAHLLADLDRGRGRVPQALRQRPGRVRLPQARRLTDVVGNVPGNADMNVEHFAEGACSGWGRRCRSRA